MQVRMAWCRRESRCARCPDAIVKGQPVVLGIFRIKNGQWAKTNRWHPQCWIDDGLAWLERHPFEELKPLGRPRLNLDEEARHARLRIIRRRAVLVHRQRKAAEQGDIPAVLDLEVQKQDLIDAIQEYGEVPKRWLENISDNPT